MRKRILSFLIVFILIIGMMPTAAIAANTDFAGGSGIEGDPYLISNKAQLNKVRNYLSAHFKLTCDIEFNESDFAEGGDFYNDGQGWMPIGASFSNGRKSFTGLLDGNGYTIYGLWANSSFLWENAEEGEAALFSINKGTIQNLTFSDGYIGTAYGYAATVAIENHGTIYNCINKNTVSTEGSTAGIAVENHGVIDACVNYGSIFGDHRAGVAAGIAIDNTGNITNCTNAGEIYAATEVDGAGIAEFNNGTIENCHNSADIYGGGGGGGIAAWNDETIRNCSNSGNIAGSSRYGASSGGIAGGSSGTIETCYNTGVIKAGSYYFPGEEEIISSAGGIVGNSIEGLIKNCYNLGSVTANSDYAYSYAGGIAGLSSAQIKNCYNTGKISSNRYAGGIAAENHDQISTCYNTGSIAAALSIGGIAGVTDGFISDCYNTGDISGDAYETANAAGGIAGDYNDGCIKKCYNVGTVEGSYAKGGIVGFNNTDSTLNVTQCYFADNVYNGIDYGPQNEQSTLKCTHIELQNQNTYTGFDFESVWTMDSGKCYPFASLQNMEHSGHYFENAQDYLCNCGHIESTRKFTDVAANAWYKEYVDYAVTHGIFSGTSATTFSPTKQMTRAQFVLVLANLSGVDTSNNNVDSGFSDVPQGQWYTSAVTWAAKNSIVSGVGDGKFNPTGVVTRQQMCVMLMNYTENYLNQSMKETTDITIFADDDDISSWAKEAVYKCAKAGLVSGTDNHTFSPKKAANRAQGATIFTLFFKEYMG